MMGRMLRFSIFGESHGRVVGTLLEGVPPGIKVDTEEMKSELRRRWGIPEGSSSRREDEEPELLSGVFDGYTTGAPLVAVLRNRDVDSSYYEEIRHTPRPGHSDYTAHIRYFGFNDYRGGGFFSGRLTAATVLAGYFAKKILEAQGIGIRAAIRRVGSVVANFSEEELMSERHPFCPDERAFE